MQTTEVAVTQDALDAQRMNKLHMQIVDAENMAKDNAADLGDMLSAKKKHDLKHGEFIPWIEANCTFTERHARRYMKVAEAKRTRVSDFDACTSIREVLDLGKEPKAPKPNLEPTEHDRRTMAHLHTLAERGATEGEREAARTKLETYASTFGYGKDEAEEQAKAQQEKEKEREETRQFTEGVKRRFKTLGQDWMADRLFWAMTQHNDIADAIIDEVG